MVQLIAHLKLRRIGEPTTTTTPQSELQNATTTKTRSIFFLSFSLFSHQTRNPPPELAKYSYHAYYSQTTVPILLKKKKREGIYLAFLDQLS